MLYLVIFILLVIFIEVLFFVKIKVVAEYVRNDDDDNLVLSFFTMNGIFKYKYEIPMVDLGKQNVKFKLVKEQGKKDKRVVSRHERLKLSEVHDKYVAIRDFYNANREMICDLRDYLRTRMVLARFNLYIKEGTGNACYTGLISGVLWSLTGVLTSFLSNSIKTYKKCVSIVPDFEGKVFNVDFYCIFHIKLVHIIVVGMKYFFNRKKEKQKIGKEIGGGLSG